VLSDFLKPYDARDTHSYPVSSRINQVASLQVDKVITVL
jgi:hypothetical protein